MKKIILYATFLWLFLSAVLPIFAQENIGMATGNYAGITGVWFNPANIADSRYKFDVNILGINSYYNNNYLLVKNTTLVRRLLYKQPYNSSFAAVKNDLLQEQLPVNGKVYARAETNIHFPLSFMASIGKKSAIAITLNNRTINKIDSMPVNLARSFFNELRDPALYGTDMRADSTQYNFLNWQEVGFTYSRVLIEGDHHFLKMGATLKWLGANAGGYIQTNQATVSFKDSQSISIQSPLIHYARTSNADFGQFSRRDIFNNIQDQAFGWDAGLVYEYRGKLEKFKYVDEHLEERTRRDVNKYIFRLGVSVVDVGKFTLNKKELTNDHSANIVNWDFSNVNASSFSQWDTAYSKQVDYVAGASKTFTYRLPVALIANFDLHLLGPLYINLAAKAPFESFKSETDTYIRANRWVAITPRFETKFFAVYVPVSRVNQRTNLGATVKFGPVYLGSNNLAQLLTNASSFEADFHAGVRFSVPYANRSKASNYVESLLKGNTRFNEKYATRVQVDSLANELLKLKIQQADSINHRDIKIIINNNDGTGSSVTSYSLDSLVIGNKASEKNKKLQSQSNNKQALLADSLAIQLAEKTVELNNLKRVAGSGNSASTSSGNASKGESNGRKRILTGKKEKVPKDKVKQVNDSEEVAKELERIRKQMAIQNAAIIGAGTAATIAVASNNSDKKDTKSEASKPAADSTIKQVADSVVKPLRDTLYLADTSKPAVIIKTDTIYIRDTVTIRTEVNTAELQLVPSENFAPILFGSGSAIIKQADVKRLKALAVKTKAHPEWRLVITGMTDAKGAVSANRKIAAARCSEVSKVLIKNGVNDSQLIIRSKLSDTNEVPASENRRRVSFMIMTR